MENNLPEGWTETLLNDVVLFQEGPGLRTIQMGITGMPFLNIRTFNDDETLDKSKCKFVKMEEFKNKYEHFLLNEGDIVVSSSGTLGKAIVIRKEDLPIMLNTSVIRFRSVSEEIMTQKYLKYFLKSDLFYKQIQEQKTGMAIDNYGPSHLQVMQIVIPPLLEQDRIVAKLDALMQKVESNKQRLNKIPKLLKRFRQSVLANAMSGAFSEEWRAKHTVEEKWKEIKLGSIASLITSGSRGWAKYYAESGSAFVRAQNISKDFLDLSDIAFVKLPEKSEGIRTLINKGDILVTITGANVTKTAFVNFDIKDAYVSQHVCLVRLKKNIFSEFVYLFLLCESHGRKQLLSLAYGQGKPQLNLENIKNVDILFPPLEEQKEIVKRVEQLFALADKIEARYTKTKAMLDKLPQTILAKAFRGELVPQDANDEPASALLERIKAEKEKKTTFKKTK